ncbi:hypothetical protein [Microscilla marina]|uniref:STAS/SEC14 domain-containing protein n=1 Tax=Microscilla marina ATCC 23134 TaxID=313606 RepID=A1ZXL7_MICM2|nr:hypothetical protein [Microscilla marina]EAY24892.1 hypothetical protein M23134_05867 [Microscilla marina ATCC 23134]
METLFSDQFNDIFYNKENGIHYHITKPATAQMTEAEFRQMVLNWKQLMLSCEPQWILIDNRDFQFPISPDLQNWVAQNVSAQVLALDSIIKSCFVLPEEFISQLSVSQLSDEAKNVSQKDSVRYFSSQEAAEVWLKSKD